MQNISNLKISVTLFVFFALLISPKEDVNAQTTTGICDRTQQVQTAIVRKIPEAHNCTDITAAHLEQITRLVLDKTNLTSLQENDLAGLTNLENLFFSENNLTELPENIFHGLTKLRSLVLWGNKLTMLPKNVFSGLTRLNSLNLGDNLLTELPQDVFSDLSSLNYLSLGNNRLTELPENVFHGVPNLIRLGLFSNQLMEIPERTFSGLSSLKDLELDRNQLTALPGNVFSGLSSLEFLFLSHNSLNELPEGIFASLYNLKEVNFFGNPGAPFPLVLRPVQIEPNVFVIEVVEGMPVQINATLAITGETPTDVAFPIGRTQSNPITLSHTDETIPIAVNAELVHTSDSFSFTLSSQANPTDNPPSIEEVRGGICDRTKQVQDAIIAAIPKVNNCADVTLAHLRQIKRLSLSSLAYDNRITSLKEGDFADLDNLEWLFLSNNELTSIPETLFAGLSSLKILSLSNNRLEELPKRVFADLSSVYSLNLWNNKLTTLPESIFSGLTSLQQINVRDNPGLPFSLTIQLIQIEENVFVIEVAEGTPITMTAIVTATGATFVGGSTVTIPVGHTRSDPIEILPTSETVTITVRGELTSTVYDGDFIVPTQTFQLETEGSASLTLQTSTDETSTELQEQNEERIEILNQDTLITISREVTNSVQRAISARIGLNAKIPTAQLAGRSTFSELLLFSAQTFDKIHNHNQTFLIEPLLKESEFVLGFDQNASRQGLSTLSVWGSGDYQNISGDNQLSWEGAMSSFHLGSDVRVTEEVLIGVAGGWSRGEFDYTARSQQSVDRGDYAIRLFSIHPYGGWSPTSWLDVWATMGYGSGGIDIEEGQDTHNTDIQMYSGSLGVSAYVARDSSSFASGVTNFKIKARTAFAIVDVDGNGDMIDTLTTEAYQNRIGIEGSYEGRYAAGIRFTPSIELAFRNDIGDGETGNGLEIDGKMEYIVPNVGLKASLNGRWLAFHSGDIEEWGIGGFIRFDPGSSEGEGFQFTLSPVLGQTRDSTLEAGGVDTRDEIQLTTELGYGFRVGRGLLTPSAGLQFANGGGRGYQVETRYTVDTFSLSLEGERTERNTQRLKEESLTLEGSLRF